MKLRFGLIAIALLAGCGGGGGGSSPEQPVSPVPEPPVTTPPVTVEIDPVVPPGDGSLPGEAPPLDPPIVPVPPVDPPSGTDRNPRAPVAVDDQFIIGENLAPFSMNVLANDFDTAGLELRLENVTTGLGTAFIDAGILWYFAPGNFIGRDVLSYELRNSAGLEAQANVEVLVVSEDGRTIELTWDSPQADTDIEGVIISQRNIDYPYLETVINRPADTQNPQAQNSVFLTIAEAGRFELKVAFVDLSGAQSAWSDAVITEILAN